MIISHRHKFIFMHNPKAAGSTVTVECNRHLGPTDIQTGVWEMSLDRGGRLNRKAIAVLLLHAPRLLASSLKWSLKREAGIALVSRKGIDKTIQKHYQNFFSDGGHPTAEEVRKCFPDAWSDYFKFAIVRNPWTHAVSYYNFRLQEKALGQDVVTFSEFLKRIHDVRRPDPEHVRPSHGTGWATFAIDNNVAVDHVIRFEDLERELEVISLKIGIALNGSIRVNRAAHPREKPLESYYDNETCLLVEKLYEREIKEFGYTPPFD